MLFKLKMLAAFFALLAVSACVSTGTKEITRSDTTSRLETGKSTKADVAALLGYPALVCYGPKSEETWNYYYVTEYPRAVDFVPVVVAFSGSLKQTTRELSVGFDRQGVVRNLEKNCATGSAEIYPF